MENVSDKNKIEAAGVKKEMEKMAQEWESESEKMKSLESAIVAANEYFIKGDQNGFVQILENRGATHDEALKIWENKLSENIIGKINKNNPEDKLADTEAILAGMFKGSEVASEIRDALKVEEPVSVLQKEPVSGETHDFGDEADFMEEMGMASASVQKPLEYEKSDRIIGLDNFEKSKEEVIGQVEPIIREAAVEPKIRVDIEKVAMGDKNVREIAQDDKLIIIAAPATEIVSESQIPESAKIINPEKSPEKILAEKRNGYVEAVAEWKKIVKSGIKSGKEEAIDKVNLAKKEYDESKVEYGKKLYSDKKAELVAAGIKDEEMEGELKKFQATEIFYNLVIAESKNLEYAKIETLPLKEKGIVKKGLDWYLKQNKYARLLGSALLATAATGGFAAASAAALFAGQRFARGLFGMTIGAGVGGKVESMLSKGIEEKKEAGLEKMRSGFSLEKFEATEEQYAKFMDEMKDVEKRKIVLGSLAAMAVGAGAAVGLKALEDSMNDFGVKIQRPEINKDLSAIKAAANYIETAREGDSVWKLAEHQLENNYGSRFSSLGEAQKNYIIDSIKNKVAEHPEKFGLIDVDKVAVGQKIDFSGIFENKEEIEKFFAGASKAQEIGIIDIPAGNVSAVESGGESKISLNENLEIKSDYFVNQPVLSSEIAGAGVSEGDSVEISDYEAPAENIANIVSEKQKIFDTLVGKDFMTTGEKFNELIGNIKQQSVKIEDFANYYVDKISAVDASIKMSDELLNNLKIQFKAIIEGSGLEKQSAETVVKSMVQRLESINK